MNSQNMAMMVALLFVFLMLIGFSLMENVNRNQRDMYQLGYILISAIVLYMIVSSSGGKHNHKNTPLRRKLRKLDMVIVVASWCGYSRKALELLEQEGVKDLFKVVDNESAEFRQLKKRYDVKAFPTWISLKREVSFSGFNRDLNKLVDRVNRQSPDSRPVPAHEHRVPDHEHRVPDHEHRVPDHEHENDHHHHGNPSQDVKEDYNENSHNIIKKHFNEDNPLVVMQRSGCPHCDRMKEMIEKAGLKDYVVMTSSSEAVKNYGVNSNDVPGVPAFILKNNPGKVVLGARPSLEKVLEELEA